VYAQLSTVYKDGSIHFIDNSAGEYGGEECQDVVKRGLVSANTLENGRDISQRHGIESQTLKIVVYCHDHESRSPMHVESLYGSRVLFPGVETPA